MDPRALPLRAGPRLEAFGDMDQGCPVHDRDDRRDRGVATPRVGARRNRKGGPTGARPCQRARLHAGSHADSRGAQRSAAGPGLVRRPDHRRLVAVGDRQRGRRVLQEAARHRSARAENRERLPLGAVPCLERGRHRAIEPSEDAREACFDQDAGCQGVWRGGATDWTVGRRSRGSCRADVRSDRGGRAAPADWRLHCGPSRQPSAEHRNRLGRRGWCAADGRSRIGQGEIRRRAPFAQADREGDSPAAPGAGGPAGAIAAAAQKLVDDGVSQQVHRSPSGRRRRAAAHLAIHRRIAERNRHLARRTIRDGAARQRGLAR